MKAGRVPNIDDEYGRAWNFNHDEVRKRAGEGEGKPWLRPDEAPKWGANWDEDRGAGDYPQGYRFCVEACPYKKVYFDPASRWHCPCTPSSGSRPTSTTCLR